MEVYILDDQLRRETVIDRFESLIWTERYSAFGDFQLVIHSNIESRTLLTKGKRLANNNSKRVMTIENIEDSEDAEGRSVLTLTGRSIEATLLNRGTQRNSLVTGAAPSVWNITAQGLFATVNAIFDTICRNNVSIPEDNIPFITAGTLYDANTISEPAASLTFKVPYKSVYEVIKEICDEFGVGFRLYRGPDDSTVYFNVYTGNDHTTAQTSLPAVIFSPDLENMTNVSQFSSIENHKNVAYVIAPNGTRMVYAIGYDALNATGFERRVLMVDANDITLAAGTPLQEALELRGQQELAKARAITALDGEISQYSSYRYGVHYELGDLLELRGEDGVTNRMRVTEQIFVDDAQGERSYPTLAVDTFIAPGTWAAWDANATWDVTTGVWAFAGGEMSDANLLPNGDISMGSTYGWSSSGTSTISLTTVAGEFRNIAGLKAVTTAINSGMVSALATLARSPVGAYTGSVWVKTTTAHTYIVKIQEYTTGGTLVGESTAVAGNGNGAFQQVNPTYTKVQADSVLRILVAKDATGTIFVDDAEIRKVL